MAVEEREVRIHRTPPSQPRRFEAEEPPIGELFRDLTTDATTLIRQEVALAKAELRTSAKQVGKDAAKLGVAAALGWFGAMAAVAFLILALGALIDSYWLSSLIVAVVFLGIAAIMANSAKKDMQHAELKPTQTIETLRADADWAKREARDLKREMRSPARNPNR